VRLPDGCGLDLVGALRSEAGKKVPAIALSGLREERDYTRAFAVGAVDYLTKPFSRDELLARCAIHLARTCAFEPPNSIESALPEKDGLAFGRYRIERELGRGGYGKVYLAHDAHQNNAPVALKVLAPLAGEQAEARVRFIRETYALSSVHDSNVVGVLDVGSVQGRLYFSMEYIAGEGLWRRMQRQGPFDEAAARQVARGLLRALCAIEGAGILHRDIKPDNVILRDGQLDEPVLVDFGLAKRPRYRGVTDADMLVGTLCYLPPEVIRGQDPDIRGDLFALGLTLRAILTGEEVFPGLQGVELLSAIAKGPIPLPICPLSPRFARFMATLLASYPERRYASAAIALQALEALSSDPPAPRPGTRNPNAESTEEMARRIV
jgi:serine/threonine-protein kinase